MKRNSIIVGTLWLMIAGIITRLLGFVYRIYLSSLIGSEGMGLYQLISPIYFLLFTICSAGCQTAISQLVAAENAHGHTHNMKRILWSCLIPSTLLGLILCFFTHRYAYWIASYLLHDARAASSIQILCLGLPFCTSSSCFKAYFHGLQRMDVPAIEQVIEQLFRMAVIYFLSPLLSRSDVASTCTYVVYGTVAGDLISCLYTVIAYSVYRRRLPSSSYRDPFPHLLKPILFIVIPVTGSRLLTQLLSSFENIMLPTVLQRAGMSSSAALSIYGEFSGMVMPLLAFPSIITGALSSNLLPLVASAKASGNYRLIHLSIHRSLRLTFLISFLFTAIWGSLGVIIGNALYPGTQAGALLRLIGFFCPFLYLQSTLGGLLNGSGLQNQMFLYQLLSSGLRIFILLTFGPHYGFTAFLLGMLGSMILSTVLSLWKILSTYHMKLSLLKGLGLPFLSGLATLLLLCWAVSYPPFALSTSLPALCIACLAGCLIYFGALCASGSLTKKDLQEVLKLVRHKT